MTSKYENLKDYDETIEERIARYEKYGIINPSCKTCQEVFYPALKCGEIVIMAPKHIASNYCESGKRPHCTCDICF